MLQATRQSTPPGQVLRHSISLLTAQFIISFFQNWHAIISSSLASLLLLGISTLIAIALAIHTELVPKKYLQIGIQPETPTKKRQRERERERDRELESLSNITQIRAQSPSSSSGQHQHQRRPAPSSGSSSKPSCKPSALPTGSAGIRGAIGISWLLPLLFAVAAPLICSIIGKWPRHWWLEVLATGDGGDGGVEIPTDGRTDAEAGEFDGVFYSTHSLLNGDNLLLEMGNGTGPPPTETSFDAASTSTTSISGGSSDSFWSQERQLPGVAWSGGSGTSTSSSSSSSSSVSSSTSVSVSAMAAPLTSGLSDLNRIGGGPSTAMSPSLSFVLFVCIDLLFILLFFALFAILMKKLLWLWHKNRNVHTHPLDKFNLALRRR